MLSSIYWCNLDPSFHESESVGRQLLHKWHQHSIPPSQKISPLPPLHQHYLASTSFFISTATKHLTFLNSMISCRTQNPESSTNALPLPQIGPAGLNNKTQVAPPLSLYSVFPKYLGRSFPLTNSIPNKIPKNCYG